MYVCMCVFVFVCTHVCSCIYLRVYVFCVNVMRAFEVDMIQFLYAVIKAAIGTHDMYNNRFRIIS